MQDRREEIQGGGWQQLRGDIFPSAKANVKRGAGAATFNATLGFRKEGGCKKGETLIPERVFNQPAASTKGHTPPLRE